MNIKKKTAIEVLKAWHAIEFFQPYTINNECESEFIINNFNSSSKQQLPWSGKPIKKSYYEIYIGIFSRDQVIEIIEKTFGKETNSILAEDIKQRFDNNGEACFAKLEVDSDGQPNLASLSVSTLPWALGKLFNGQLNDLSYALYKSELAELEQTINALFKLDTIDDKTDTHKLLSIKDLKDLIKLFNSWAEGFEIGVNTDSNYIIRGHTRKKKTKSQSQKNNNNTESTPIFNSFYIEDIEKAIHAIEYNHADKALLDYLKIDHSGRIDLYTSSSLKIITDKLSPKSTPLGRWPSDSSDNMSLMQQFAINTIINELKESGIISVNGPPGTGKTTLLRELIAHNMVERAKVLAAFSSVENTINKDGCIVNALHGFEMVIASSNNAAVNNISQQLPLLSSIGEEYKQIEYLKPVANQLLAKRKTAKKNSKDERDKGFSPLDKSQICWGSITAKLGNKENCEDFVERFFFNKQLGVDSKEYEKRDPEEDFLNIWRFSKLSQCQTFAQARSHFQCCLKACETQQRELESYCTLNSFFSDNPLIDEFLSDTIEALEEEKNTRQLLLNELIIIRDKKIGHKSEIEDKIKLIQDLEKTKPGFIKRFFLRKLYKTYILQIADAKASLDQLNSNLKIVENNYVEKKEILNTVNFSIEEIQQKINRDTISYQENVAQMSFLKEKYSFKIMPDDDASIDNPNIQRNTFWQNQLINKLRSDLFCAAMNLHQAWVNEALTHEQFRKIVFRICDLIKNPYKFTDEIERIVYWRNFFMLVPVISTTFASVSRMFHGVSSSQLAWLMIDEAGQALPQAAVGAIMRSKRVLLVGDPLQIEPVFTTHPRLTQSICNHFLADKADQWNPTSWSLQQLVDRSNSFGCTINVNDQTTWIGIPLWVHRRCKEPMFSLVNKIAYNGRMIHGHCDELIKKHLINGELENFWQDSQGKMIQQQYTSDLGEKTKELLAKLLGLKCELSSIYIITPFKAVKDQLTASFKNMSNDDWKNIGLGEVKKVLTMYWCNANIGTVHTFQGKENKIVILVLGCDVYHQGGAMWASSKPNLLNVALARAKENIFVIGNLKVWKQRKYFRYLASTLKIQDS